MQVDLTLEEKSAAAVLAVGELAAIKAEQVAGIGIDAVEVSLLLSLANKCRPDGTGEITWDDITPLDPEDEEPGDEPEQQHIPV